MNTKRLLLFILLALGALALSACGAQPLANNWPGLAADEERAYISSGSFVYAVDVTSGREVWRYPAEADNKLIFYATPVLTEDGHLLIGSAGTAHPFVSIDPETGRENWAAPFESGKGAWVASPLVMNEVIYAPNTDGFLYVLDMRGRQIADPVKLGGALWSAPVTDGSLIYVTSLDHHLHIINPSNLSLSAAPIGLGGAAPGSPAVGDGGVFVGSFAAKLEFFQSNGNRQVLANTGSWIWGTPVLDGDTLYYADLDGKIYSLDLATNRQNWDNIQPDGPVVGSLLIADDQIYVATESGSFFALDRNGRIIWEKIPGGSIYTAPVLSGDLILVAPYQADFALAAYDVDGRQAWTFKP